MNRQYGDADVKAIKCHLTTLPKPHRTSGRSWWTLIKQSIIGGFERTVGGKITQKIMRVTFPLENRSGPCKPQAANGSKAGIKDIVIVGLRAQREKMPTTRQEKVSVQRRNSIINGLATVNVLQPLQPTPFVQLISHIRTLQPLQPRPFLSPNVKIPTLQPLQPISIYY